MKSKKQLTQQTEKLFINNDTTWLETQSKKEVQGKAKELESKGINEKISHNKITTRIEELYWNERFEKKKKQEEME